MHIEAEILRSVIDVVDKDQVLRLQRPLIHLPRKKLLTSASVEEGRRDRRMYKFQENFYITAR